MKTIQIELSVESCNAAIKELKAYEREIKPMMMEVCKRLAEIGFQEAQTRLIHAYGNDDARLDPPMPIENGYKIAMSGEDVYFVEFGTGDATDAHGYTSVVDVSPGSFSKQNAQMYSTYGFWWYGGEKLQETPAYKPLYYASKKMREEMPRVVREVFGK